MNYFAKVIKLDDNIAKSKNRALKEALKSPYNHFFLVEDIVKVNDDSIYQRFIETHEKTGIHCLMWANATPNRRVEFNDDKYVDYWSDFSPCFTYYSREAIKKVGLFDENMPPNTWQEIEHAKRIGDAGLSSPFGMFPSPKEVFGLEIMGDRVKCFNRLKMDEALSYWENKDGEEFPIKVKKAKTATKITEMI